jgi:hypothetical protein
MTYICPKCDKDLRLPAHAYQTREQRLSAMEHIQKCRGKPTIVFTLDDLEKFLKDNEIILVDAKTYDGDTFRIPDGRIVSFKFLKRKMER